MTVSIELPTLADTQALALRIAAQLVPPQTVALTGALGSGKTQLVRFLVEALSVEEAEVTSPTYVLMNVYQPSSLSKGSKIYHLDFYRLQSSAQVWDLAIDELYEQPAIVLIEWADKFPECLPDDCFTIALSQADEDLRQATLSASGPRSSRLLSDLFTKSQ